MGNHVSNAKQGTDGYWYWAPCAEKGCTPPQAHYRVYNKNAGKVPVVSDAQAGYMLFDVPTMEEMLSNDEYRNDFLREWYHLESGVEKLPDNPCIRVSPCHGIVKEKNLCCDSSNAANTDIIHITEEQKEQGMSSFKWFMIISIASILILLSVIGAFYYSFPLSKET